MSELHEPPLRLTVEALRWSNEAWELTGRPASIELHNTDTGETNGGQLIRLFRTTVNERLTILVPMLILKYHELEFEAPNAPTEADLRQLKFQAEKIHEALAVLEQLAPSVIEEEAEGAER